MFKISQRRFTGAKTKLLKQIETCLLKHLHTFDNSTNLSFFDVFAGTAVVSEYFLTHYAQIDKKPHFKHFILNDFLHSNYAIYQGFFLKADFNAQKLELLQQELSTLNAQTLRTNYYEKSFGGLFFSQNDARIIGYIRDKLDDLLKLHHITQKEFYILLTSLIYSSDRIANTVGHYDAYRKNIILEDRFKFELISPIKTTCSVEIFKEDANVLVKNLKQKIDVAFIDPPYNSRQYSRFYHLLETLSKNDKPKLYGVARKPSPENSSLYCQNKAKEVFEDLVKNLAKHSKILLVTYNNTTSANARSNTRMDKKQITEILNSVGKTYQYEFFYKEFQSGKTNFNNHKEMIFVCEVGQI